MRIIDADKLYPDCISNKGIAITQNQIANAPTIPNEYMRGYDAARRVYKRPDGEWLTNYTSQFMNPGRHCSLCGKVVEFSENFCPECGADMRGDTE